MRLPWEDKPHAYGRIRSPKNVTVHASSEGTSRVTSFNPSAGEIAETVKAHFPEAHITFEPDEQRQAIALAYYQDMSHSQIAEYLGIPLGTVKTRIRLGMQKLRAAWQTADSNRSDSGESDV